MQEIMLFLSSVAGIATAAAIRKIPKNRKPILTVGASSQIKNQIGTLKIEKEILSKTISRLYQHEAGLDKIQRDRLLIRYQHQLGIVLAKIEKLEAASKHPDLGPVGDGLITLMDQKLSQLDQRLYELTSKITVTNGQTQETNQKLKSTVKPNEEAKKLDTTPQIQKEETKKVTSEPMSTVLAQPKKVEITTLTELPTKISEFPIIEERPSKVEEKIEILQSSFGSINLDKPEEKELPKPTIRLPEEEEIDEGSDELAKIMGEVRKTLSKLEQAEVE